MSKTLEYILRLKDQMSAGLQKAGLNSDSLKRKIAGVETQINSLDRKIASAGPRMANSFKDAINQIPFGNILFNPFVLAGAAAGRAISLGIQQDMQNTSFEVLLNGKAAAERLQKDIADYGMKSPYEKMGLSENAKTMLGFGIAQDKIMPTLKAIGDIAMGDAQRMQSLTLAFSQATSAGKLQGQDLLQMINAGFNPLNEISKLTGKSIGQLREEMEKGKISADLLETAIMKATGTGGQFNGMADKMGQTLGGKWSSFMDSVNEKFLILYEYVRPLGIFIVDVLTKGLDWITRGFGWLFDKFREGNPIVLALTAIIGGLLVKMILFNTWTMIVRGAILLWQGAQWLLNVALLANPVGLIIAGVMLLIAAIGYLIFRYSGWGDAWRNLVTFMSASWQEFKSGFYLVWLEVQNFFLGGVDKLKTAWYSFQSLWDEESAGAGMAKMNDEAAKRAKEYADTKGLVAQYQAQQRAAWGKIGLKDTGKSFGDMFGDTKKMFGIADAKIPGAGSVNSKFGGSGGGGKGAGAGKKGNEAVATGGTKNTTIHITIGKQIESLVVQTTGSMKESANEIYEQVLDAMTRVVASTQAIAE